MFKKAEKKAVYLKIALTGPSGSGKTFSALTIASGIGKKIALIDTENQTASLYADKFEFDTVDLKPPYTVQKYVDAIKAAVAAGYDVLVIDSISHAWAGDGGLLAQKEALDARGAAGEKRNKNQYTNWAAITKQHESFRAWLLQANIHTICTMRSKQEYAVGEGGKVQKLGMAPIQRDGMEYEFTTVLDLGMDHHAAPSKDRTGMWDNQFFIPTVETGMAFINWLGTEKPQQMPSPDAKPALPDRTLPQQDPNLMKKMFAVGKSNNYDGEGVGFIAKKLFPQIKSRTQLTNAQIKQVISYMEKNPIVIDEVNDFADADPFPFETTQEVGQVEVSQEIPKTA